ncbi:MAG: hypothetical protein IPK87_00655 [Planctomycetes bacterium]|nr:hypothetical protein [Planctomycetota bacterium]
MSKSSKTEKREPGIRLLFLVTGVVVLGAVAFFVVYKVSGGDVAVPGAAGGTAEEPAAEYYEDSGFSIGKWEILERRKKSAGTGFAWVYLDGETLSEFGLARGWSEEGALLYEDRVFDDRGEQVQPLQRDPVTGKVQQALPFAKIVRIHFRPDGSVASEQVIAMKGQLETPVHDAGR